MSMLRAAAMGAALAFTAASQLSCASASAGGTASAAADAPLKVELIDMEGGAALLFVTPEGQSLLVDTGWRAGSPSPPPGAAFAPGSSSVERIKAAAARLGVTRINYLMISHYHGDHMGGFFDLLAAMPVDTIIDHGENREIVPPEMTVVPPAHISRNFPGFYEKYQAAIPPRERRVVKAGDTLNIGSLRLDIVAADKATIPPPPGAAPGPASCATPPPPAVRFDENPHSIAFVATFGGVRILHTADLSEEFEYRLTCPRNLLGRIDMLIVPHHGSRVSNGKPFWETVRPRVALMGNGAQKGGDEGTFANIAASPAPPVLWQSHTALRSPAVNRPDNYIANLATPVDSFHPLVASVYRDGRIQVTNARNGYSETYPKR
jgi:competence protein ComEC